MGAHFWAQIDVFTIEKQRSEDAHNPITAGGFISNNGVFGLSSWRSVDCYSLVSIRTHFDTDSGFDTDLVLI